MTKFSTLSVTGVLAASLAPAAVGATLDVYDVSGPEFIAGDGIGITGFQQVGLTPVDGAPAQAPTLSLRARDRNPASGPVSIGGNRYAVNPGTVANNNGVQVPNLTIDYQFDPGAFLTTTNYVLSLRLDYDPAAGTPSTDFEAITLPIFDTGTATVDSWEETDGFFTNPGPGAWTDDTVPYVVANSARLDFFSGFFNRNYDPSVNGEYGIELELLDPTGQSSLGLVSAVAVVPEPASLALLGAGAVLLVGRRRA